MGHKRTEEFNVPLSTESIAARIAEHEFKHAQNQEAIKANEKAVQSLSDHVIRQFEKLNNKTDEQTEKLYEHINRQALSITSKIEEQTSGRSKAIPVLLLGLVGLFGTALGMGGTVITFYVRGEVGPLASSVQAVRDESKARDAVIDKRIESLLEVLIRYGEHDRETYGQMRAIEARQQMVIEGRIKLAP